MITTGVGRIFGERHVEFGPDGEHGATHPPLLPRFVSSVDRIIFVFARYRVVPLAQYAIIFPPSNKFGEWCRRTVDRPAPCDVTVSILRRLCLVFNRNFFLPIDLVGIVKIVRIVAFF